MYLILDVLLSRVDFCSHHFNNTDLFYHQEILSVLFFYSHTNLPSTIIPNQVISTLFSLSIILDVL